MWRRWSSSWPTAPTRRPKTWYAHHSKLIGWRRKGEREEGCSAARGPVMRGAQARMSRPHKRTTHRITFILKSDPRSHARETSDRERAPARCCLQSLSAFEHHGVELRQHAHTTCAQPGWLSTGQRSLQQRPCCCAHRPEPLSLLRPSLSCALRVSRAHCIARAASSSLPPRRVAARPSITLR